MMVQWQGHATQSVKFAENRFIVHPLEKPTGEADVAVVNVCHKIPNISLIFVRQNWVNPDQTCKGKEIPAMEKSGISIRVLVTTIRKRLSITYGKKIVVENDLDPRFKK